VCPADQASVVRHGIAETDVADHTGHDPPQQSERFAAPAPGSQLPALPPCPIRTRFPHQMILSKLDTLFSEPHSNAGTPSIFYVEQAFFHCQM
jgi:hypothetical protein